MANKKIWAYAKGDSGNFIKDERGRLKLFFIWQVLKLKKHDIFEFNKLRFWFKIKNFKYFLFFRRLTHNSSIEELKSTMKINNKDIKVYIKKLEVFGLIQQHGDQIRLLQTGYLKIQKNSLLDLAVKKHWAIELTRKTTSTPPDNNYKTFCMSTGLSEQNRNHFYQDLESLLERYRKLGFIDQSFESHGPLGVAIVSGPHRVGTLGSL